MSFASFNTPYHPKNTASVLKLGYETSSH